MFEDLERYFLPSLDLGDGGLQLPRTMTTKRPKCSREGPEGGMLEASQTYEEAIWL